MTLDVRTVLVGGLLHIRGEPCRQFSFGFRLAFGKLTAGVGHANAEIRNDQQQNGREDAANKSKNRAAP
jgi:hypothetical protein